MPDSNQPSETTTVALCRIETLRERRALGFEIPFGETTQEIFLVADGEHVRGYFDRCPHRGTPQPALFTTVRSETDQGCGMGGFRDRGARRHSRHYVEHSDRAKAGQGAPLGRRSRRVVRNAG